MEIDNSEVVLERANQLKSEFPVGTIFASIQEFVDSFTDSAGLKNILFIVKQRNTKILCLACKNINCQFKVNSYFKADLNICKISKMEPIHKCGEVIRISSSKSVIKVASRDADLSMLNPKGLMSNLQHISNLNISYTTAYKSIKSYKTAIDLILEDSYCYLQSLLNSGSSENHLTNLLMMTIDFKECFSHGMLLNIFLCSPEK
jgi:hypothetical protein